MKNEYKLIRGFSAPDEERSVDSAREKIFRCVARDRTVVPGHHHHGGDGEGGDDDDFYGDNDKARAECPWKLVEKDWFIMKSRNNLRLVREQKLSFSKLMFF